MSTKGLSRKYRALSLKRTIPNDDPFLSAPVLATIKQSRGFIQPVGGAETFSHVKPDQLVTHRLYSPVDLPALYGDIVVQGGDSYNVEYADQPDGISGVQHHKEILLSRYGNGR